MRPAPDDARSQAGCSVKPHLTRAAAGLSIIMPDLAVQALVQAIHFVLTDMTPGMRDCWVFSDSRIQLRAVNPDPRRHPLHGALYMPRHVAHHALDRPPPPPPPPRPAQTMPPPMRRAFVRPPLTSTECGWFHRPACKQDDECSPHGPHPVLMVSPAW